jgi:hypothetical protein
VDLARDCRALLLDAGLQVLGQLMQPFLRGDEVAVGLDAGRLVSAASTAWSRAGTSRARWLFCR